MSAWSEASQFNSALSAVAAAAAEVGANSVALYVRGIL